MSETRDILVCAGVVVWTGGGGSGMLLSTTDEVVVGDRVSTDPDTGLATKRVDVQPSVEVVDEGGVVEESAVVGSTAAVDPVS